MTQTSNIMTAEPLPEPRSNGGADLPWTTTEEGNPASETAKAYGALWGARAFVRFYVDCKRRSSLSKTILKNFWLLADPLAQMLIYYFLVAVVFNSRAVEGKPHPFVFIMLGIVHYLVFQRIVVSGMRSVLSNERLLMQLKVEPLIFFGVSSYDAMRQFILSLSIYGIFFLILGDGLHARMMFYPLLLGILLFLAWCLSVFFGTLLVFFRDLEHIVRIGMRMLMYATPVIYLVTFVPEGLRFYYLFNPIACLFSLMQWCLLGEPFPHMGAVISLGVFVVVCAFLSHFIYIRLRTRFTKAF